MGFKVVDLEARNIIKSGSSDSYVLLGGGGHKAVSDFATSGHTHSYLPLSGGTISSSDWAALSIKRNSSSGCSIKFENTSGVIGYIGINASSLQPQFSDTSGVDYKIWHAGNDGSGSGLDADTLDGNHATSFATSGHNHDGRYIKSSGDSTITGGNLTIDKNNGCYMINNSALDESIAFGNTSSSSGSSFSYIYATNNATGAGFDYMTFRNHKVGVCSRTNPQYNLDVNGSVNGTTIYENGTLLSEKYFPHSAGYYHPLTSYLRISNGEDSKIVLDNTDNETYYQFIEFKQNDTRYGVLGTFGDTNLKWGSNIILHAGNYSSYALPLSGGTMSNTNLVTNLNADKLDGYDANVVGTAGIIAVNRGDQHGYYHLYTKIGYLPTVAGTGSGESFVVFHIYNAIDFGSNDPAEWVVTASSRGSYNVQARKIVGRDQLTIGYVIVNDHMEIWVNFDGWYMGKTSFKVESSNNFTNEFSQTQTAPTGFVAGTKTYLLDGSTLTNSEIDTIIV